MKHVKIGVELLRAVYYEECHRVRISFAIRSTKHHGFYAKAKT